MVSDNIIIYLFTEKQATISKIASFCKIPKSKVVQSLKNAGIDISIAKREPKYSKEDSLKAIRQFCLETGKITIKEYRELDYKPSSSTIKSHFGTWEKALEEAGIKEPTKHKYHKAYFDMDKRIEKGKEKKEQEQKRIIEIMTEHFKVFPKLISPKLYKESGLDPSINIICSQFGSWRNMLLKMGIDLNTKGRI